MTAAAVLAYTALAPAGFAVLVAQTMRLRGLFYPAVFTAVTLACVSRLLAREWAAAALIATLDACFTWMWWRSRHGKDTGGAS